MPPLLKSTKPILMSWTISNLLCISSSPNSSETLPVEASIGMWSSPNQATGEVALWLLLELLGHQDTTEPPQSSFDHH